MKDLLSSIKFYFFYLDGLTEEDLINLLSTSSGSPGKRNQSYIFPDYEYVHEELGKAHVTLTMLWGEYVEGRLVEGKRYYRETQFRHHYHQYAKNEKRTVRLERRSGLSLQADWAEVPASLSFTRMQEH